MGGTPLPLQGSPLNFYGIRFLKGLQLLFWFRKHLALPKCPLWDKIDNKTFDRLPNIEPKSIQFSLKTIKSAEDTVKHEDCIRRACEQESGKSVTQRERSPPRGGRPNIQEGGAQISRPAAWRSCPNICLHTACGDPQGVRTPPTSQHPQLAPAYCPNPLWT